MRKNIVQLTAMAASASLAIAGSVNLRAQQKPSFTPETSAYLCESAYVPHTSQNGTDGLGASGHVEFSVNTLPLCKGNFKQQLILCGNGHGAPLASGVYCAPDAQYDEAALLKINSELSEAARAGLQVDITWQECDVIIGSNPGQTLVTSLCPLFISSTGRN